MSCRFQPRTSTGFGRFALEANGKEMSTTMAFVRMLSALLKDREIGARIVPIIADEARTFGMADLFSHGRHLLAGRSAVRT